MSKPTARQMLEAENTAYKAYQECMDEANKIAQAAHEDATKLFEQVLNDELEKHGMEDEHE